MVMNSERQMNGKFKFKGNTYMHQQEYLLVA